MCFSPLEKPLFCILDSFSTKSQQIPLLSRFLGLTSTASQQKGQSIKPNYCALCLLNTCLTDSRSIEVGFFSIDFQHLLNQSRYPCMLFTFLCFAFFFFLILLSIASCFVTFMHLYGFLVSLDHIRSSLCFSGEVL